MWPSEPHTQSASVDTTVSCVNVCERSLLHMPLHVWFRSWLCAAYTPAQHISAARCLTCEMTERRTKRSLLLF